MNTIVIRFSDGEFFASMDDSEMEGVGETISEALRDLADNIELRQI